jgi:hypothetical protein
MPTTRQRPKGDRKDALEPIPIDATVTISRGDDPDRFQHDVQALSAAGPAGSQWIVTWTLVASSGLSVAFKNSGIMIPAPDTSIPAGIKDLELHPRVSPTQQQLTFTNDVSDVNVIRYDFDLDVVDLDSKKRLTRSLIFDPTITVVKDPIGS